MPFKLNNMYIVEKIEDIPVNDLFVGRQVLLVEPHQDRESQKIMDKTTHMTLERIDMGRLYRFWANITIPIIQINDKKFQGIQDELGEDACGDMSEEAFAELCVQTSTEDIIADTDMDHIEMMQLGGKLIHLQVNKDGEFDIKKGGYDPEYGGKNNSKVAQLWKKIFDWTINWEPIHGNYTEQNIFTQFMSIPLENGKLALAFVIDHDIRVQGRHWNTNEHVYLLNKEGDITELKVPLKYMYKKVKETKIATRYEKDFAKFDEILQAHDYDIRQFIEDGGRGLSLVKKVFLEQKQFEIYNGLDKLYSPFFTYDGVSVYPDSVRGWHQSPRLVVDGKEVGWRGEQKYPEQYRVGKQFMEFYRYNPSGINPETGEIVNNENLKLVYGDDEGLILKGYNNADIYYIKMIGYFVCAEVSKDEAAIKELKERKGLMDHMKSLQPIHKAV